MPRRYLAFAMAVLGALLTGYLVVTAFGPAVLERPNLDEPGLATAFTAITLLTVDALLPVAGSLVMVSVGALYDPPAAVAIALAGRLGMAALGFAVGRRGRPALEQHSSASEQARVQALLRRHGALAIAITRPVPLLAETVLVLAGASRMSWWRALTAAVLGSVPEAVAYALAGNLASSLGNTALIWTATLVVALGLWAVTAPRRIRPAADPTDPAAAP